MFLFVTLVVLATLVGASAFAGKYRTVKAIDVAGLNFLTPVVRLCYGEEPEKQIRDILRFIVVPAGAVLLFVGLWNYIAPKHKTKSGEVPTAFVTWDSAKSIWVFHERESDKADAYAQTGTDREEMLGATEQRLAELAKLEPLADEQVARVREESKAATNALVAPLLAQKEQMAADFKQLQNRRELALKAMAADLKPGTAQGKDDYVKLVAKHRQKTDQEREELKLLATEVDAQRSKATPALDKALRVQTVIAEERQYLAKKLDLLSSANRSEKIEKLQASLHEQQMELIAAEGDEAYTLANSIVRAEERIESTAESTYANAATLPYQTRRSLLCVFCGFVLGSSIAIPLGILCGLSKTFMAAMTPFIALFKPVSPIVWLPVAMIIIGGFIPDPDKHWLMQGLWDLPLIGQYKINPAFIASAITVALCSLWATLTNTAFGVASVEKDHMNVARVLRLGFWDRLFKIVLPSALPLVFAGLRISLGVGWMVLIAAELLSSSEGIGKFVWDQFSNGASDSFAKMMVVVFVVGFIGLVLDRIMIVLQRLVSFDGAPTAI